VTPPRMAPENQIAAIPDERRARPPAIGRRGMLFLLLGLLASAGLLVFGAEPVITKEYQLKAAFLYNFSKFVQWPSSRFEDETSPIVIAVLSPSPFGDELDRLVRDRLVNGRAIDVRLIESTADIPAAHIVFIPAGAEARLNTGHLDEPGVLTVGESADFAARDGIIRFTLIDEKVRFEINQHSAEKAGLKLSGQLLKLATVIRTTP
jgi:hypothetical protein